MPPTAAVYDAFVRVLRRASPLLAGGPSKLARGIRGRREALDVFLDWSREDRTPGQPLLWMHAPSVGEGLQARAVLRLLAENRPDLQIAYSYFSPSARDFARTVPVQVTGYLPWDVRAEMERLLGGLRPDLVAFTKTEVWPGVAAAARAREVPVVLAAATLPPGAGRLGFPARLLLRRTFASLAEVLAISQDDGERFLRLGVREERIRVTGDPAIDSAWRRAREADPGVPYLAPFLEGSRPVLVAGSTWEADEAVLLPAMEALREVRPEVRAVIAPHEPEEGHLRRLEAALGRRGFRTARLGALESGAAPGEAGVVLVDRVGVLAHLYTVGAFAYVGGGFHRHGLHSVLEPAAAGVPVLFGPRHGNARAASDLVEGGGARVVTGSEELADALKAWIRDPGLREEAGARAAGYVRAHRGAARRTAEALARFLPGVELSSDGPG